MARHDCDVTLTEPGLSGVSLPSAGLHDLGSDPDPDPPRMSNHGSRALRVVYCTDTYPPQVNGVSIVTALSVTGLRARGWECAVVAPRYPAQRVQLASPESGFGVPDELVPVPSVAFPPYPDIRLAAPDYQIVADTIARFRPDLVHCQTEFMLGRLGQIAARHAGIPFVSSYHTDFSRYAVAYGFPWLRPSVSRYIARFHRRSRRTYTPSVPARQDLVDMGVPRVEVWGRGVDVNVFHPRRRSIPLRSAYSIDGKFVFLHVGRLAAEKGVRRILEAFGAARELLPAGAMHLVIAGTGPEERALRTSAPPDVTFLGVLDREKMLPQLYASADAFLFSSVTETLGLVILEAMACGLPVIATPAGGVADHLRDGYNGLAYSEGSTDVMAREMVSLVLNPELLRRLSAGARRTAEALSWDNELDRLDVSYREVCGQQPEYERRSSRGARRRRDELDRPLTAT